MYRSVSPDEQGRVLLTRSEAAWLARATTETLRRWTDADQSLQVHGRGRNARVDWDDLRARLAEKGEAAAHWSWLNADLAQPQTASRAAQRESDELARLRAENAALCAERDAAVADAENLDQAVMAYRDNWRRRVEPQSPKGL